MAVARPYPSAGTGRLEGVVAFEQILAFARDDDAASIRAIIRAGCPPTYRNRVGQTPLHIAGIWGRVEACKALLESGADPNASNQLRGSTPFHAASMGKGDPDKRAECIKLMIKFKGDPKKPDFGGELPMEAASDEVIRLALGAAPLVIHKAVASKQSSALAKAIEQTLQGGEIDLETVDAQGVSALHMAVAKGWLQGVDMLLRVRADPNSPDNMRRSPLHTAVLHGNHRLVDRLLDAKADVTAQDCDPEHDPRWSSKTMEETPDQHRTPLHYAAELGNLLAAKSLMKKGNAQLDAPDSQKCTPLHLCFASISDGVELEAGRGVRIHGLQKKPEWNGRLGSLVGESAPSSDGSSSRWPVLLEGDDASEPVLLKAENLDLLSEATLDLLLEAKADVNLGNAKLGEGRTLLHEAAHAGNPELLKKVLAARADINSQEKKLGFTALHLASRGKKDQIVRLLVDAKADVSQKSAGLKTAAELGETNGISPTTLALLRGEGTETQASTESQAAGFSGAQTLESLTPEQRAALFLD